MDCGTKRDSSTVPKQYHCGSLLVRWQGYFGTDTVLKFLLGIQAENYLIYIIISAMRSCWSGGMNTFFWLRRIVNFA